MKILLICSKRFYPSLERIGKILTEKGHTVIYPNCYDAPWTEDGYRHDANRHAAFKAEMFRRSEQTIAASDGVLCVNFEKDGVQNYIGGATFLELYDAFRLNKRIWLYNDLPDGILRDEVNGFSPILLHGDLENFPNA